MSGGSSISTETPEPFLEGGANSELFGHFFISRGLGVEDEEVLRGGWVKVSLISFAEERVGLSKVVEKVSFRGSGVIGGLSGMFIAGMICFGGSSRFVLVVGIH